MDTMLPRRPRERQAEPPNPPPSSWQRETPAAQREPVPPFAVPWYILRSQFVKWGRGQSSVTLPGVRGHEPFASPCPRRKAGAI